MRCHVATLECDEGTLVAHLVTVVGCTEHCYTVAIMCNLISLILNLQGSSRCTIGTKVHVMASSAIGYWLRQCCTGWVRMQQLQYVLAVMVQHGFSQLT